ncbi:MAG: hypothetical protein HW387_1142 [Parachlamydiales bacterium]|nr:hypothetical protein [Parachlamydiales bacterium]
MDKVEVTSIVHFRKIYFHNFNTYFKLPAPWINRKIKGVIGNMASFLVNLFFSSSTSVAVNEPENKTDTAIQSLKPLEIISQSKNPQTAGKEAISSTWQLIDDETPADDWVCVMPKITDQPKSHIFRFPTALTHLMEGFKIRTILGEIDIQGFWDSKKPRWHLTSLLRKIEENLKNFSMSVNHQEYSNLAMLLISFNLSPNIQTLMKQLNEMPDVNRVKILSFLCTLTDTTSSLCIYAMENKYLTKNQMAAINGHAAPRINAEYNLQKHTWNTRIEQSLLMIDLPVSTQLPATPITVIAEISQEDATFTWVERGGPAIAAPQ